MPRDGHTVDAVEAERVDRVPDVLGEDFARVVALGHCGELRAALAPASDGEHRLEMIVGLLQLIQGPDAAVDSIDFHFQVRPLIAELSMGQLA